jgi:anti-sigma B factor antagonist
MKEGKVSSVQIEKNENHAHIELREPLTLAFASELRPQLQQLIAEQVSNLVIDLSLVDLIDSSGIGLLIATRNTLSRMGGGLRVVGASSEIQHLFKIMHLDRHFEIEGKPGSGSQS